MAGNGTIAAIDADGHILERAADIASYLEGDFAGRKGAMWPGGQPWDADLGGKLGMKGYGYGRELDPAGQVAFWEKLLDEYDMDYAVLFPTGSGGMVRLQEPGFAEAATRAANKHFAKDFKTERLRPVGVLPLRNPAAAVEELRHIHGLGLRAVEVLTIGLPYALGNAFYDPVWQEAEKLGIAICVHGTRGGHEEWGADKLGSFSEVHAYAFPAGMLLQFTSVLCNAIPLKFPKLKWGFLEIGAAWLPYYLTRLDEHWQTRRRVDMKTLDRKPSDLFRQSEMIVSLEADEPYLAQTVEFAGEDHIVFASDVPHWDGEFPGNLKHIRRTNEVGESVKQKILHDNAKRFFGL